jgi:glyoxylase-like metal-dependent hydrolase (beta-lactamase superfamily II)
VGALGRGFDLFGDGSLFAVPMPGHAPRQMGLCVRDAQDRAVLLCADACWSHLTFRERRLPTWPARLVTHDWAAYVRTVERLHTLAVTAPDVAILPSHCRASLDTYRATTRGGIPCASS